MVQERNVQEYKSLGCMNGWSKNPEIVEKCQGDEARHDIEVVNIGRCYNKIICHTCKYVYSVDSSD